MLPTSATDRTPIPAATQHRTTSPLPGLAGLLSVAAMITAFMVVPADPGGTAPSDIVRRYADGSSGYLRATVIESIAITLLVVLVAGLSDGLRGLPHGQLAAAVVGLGGGVLAACQLLGYGLIATLALGTAERGDEAVVMAVYDASAIAFLASYAGLALACLGTATALIRHASSRRVVGGISLIVGATAVVGASAYASEGILSPHGDLSFLVLLLQLLWTATVSVSMIRQR